MSDALFTEAAAYTGDPLRPDLLTPTPASIVASLTRPQREQRVQYLIGQANAIVDDAISTHLGNRTLVAICVLFSGGNDSTTLAHLFRHQVSHAIHANTTIGIEATRQYVRDTCAAWGLPLVEETGNDTYEDLVLGRVRAKNGTPIWPGGFPGPGAHALMYGRLKERALDKARPRLGVSRSRTKAALWLAGRRRQESRRREDIPLHEVDGSIIWASPLAMWTKLDLNTYRLLAGDVPRNEVSDLLHMSGECLCGAFGHPGELEEIRQHFPDTAAEIEGLQARVHALGTVEEVFCTWGHGIRGAGIPTAGRLCSSCDDRFQLSLEGVG